ncbi:MAG TPA: TIGR01777 family oxidoreductase [Pseudomonadota bacterium]|nr:TIGR01777 family oxidoreductase [Pseudomonadota bacterium]
MDTFVTRVALPVPAAEAFAWHEREGALERLSPPWESVRVIEKHGTIRDGDRVVLSVAGTMGARIEHVHRDYVPGRSFVDEQVHGLFASFRHCHEVIPDGERGCVLEDRLSYTLPLGALGRTVAASSVRRRLERMFVYRHETLRRDLVRHARFADRPRLRVAITGASGVIGSALTAFLSTGGHEVLRLVRQAPGRGEVGWDPARGKIDAAALEGIDAMVHLAGENVGVRWTPERKERIIRSRVDGTQLIAATCAKLTRPPKVLISASAIGIYGVKNADTVDEQSALGDDFLADVCKRWEAAAEPARVAGLRVVHPRIGVVLSPTGGALAELLPVFRKGLGGPVGSGQQIMSWLSLDDALGTIYEALYCEDLSGPVNAVAPSPVSNAELSSTLGRVLHRPAVLRVPAVAVRAAFGEMGTLVALRGVRVAPRRLLAHNFHFFDPSLESWLRHVLGETARS